MSLPPLKTPPSALRGAVATGALFAAALLAAPGNASAANAALLLDVTPLQDTVSVGRDNLVTYAAYRVVVSNQSGNTTNQIVFGGPAEIPASGYALTGTATAPSAAFLEAVLAGTTVPSNVCTGSGALVQCSIGQLKAGESRSFVVSFVAPKLAAGVTYNETAALNFNWSLNYSSGNSSTTPSSSYTTCNGIEVQASFCNGQSPAGLITAANGDFPKRVKSYIPTSGGTFFINKGQLVRNDAGSGVACASGSRCDITAASALEKVKNAAGVVVDYAPSAAALLRIGGSEPVQTVEIENAVIVGGLNADTETTNETTIRVPVDNVPFGVPALVELRRDASTIFNKTAQAARNAPIYYEATEAYEPYQVPRQLVKNCADLPGGEPSASDPVCVLSRTAFGKAPSKRPTADDEDDWRFVLKVLQNGKASW